MKSIIVLAALLVFVLTWGANAESGAALKTVEVNTQAFWCDGTNHELNVDLSGVRVRKVFMWFGAWDYVNADIVAVLVKMDKAGQMEYVAKAGWDRYTAPTGVAGQTLTFDYAPDWVRVGTGESLRLYAQCNAMNKETETKKAHVIALIYYLP